MPNTEGDRSPKVHSMNLLMAYCEELNRLIQEQGEAVQQQDFEKVNETIKDFNRLKENIIREQGWLRNHDGSWKESKETRKTIQDLLEKAAQGSKASIRTLQESMKQIRAEVNVVNQIGTYLNRGGKQPKIIDKSV
ncbi:hypothetical protein [Candidatus Formimonas warabiya]|uniref:Flagellar protein FlgN n=1 Tax=Formimonas warabiya TaxID=1761012 RepID=A0A3G1KTB9_FORW1|nr:hypothetical protein [Candidatus Formimonas warabiya]ATW25686.1 hypothetical protein DCMF_13760 [Candidatus Formimonas warabiya]